MNGRPTKEKEYLYSERDRLIRYALLSNNNLNQSDVAKIFRIPRNTVHIIIKKSYAQIKKDILA